ncbi:persephin [Camarhynchus parvulus]|uniref:persephin n=1 Tax=Geospiza parvula TaxID=87175 RepID=UPI0012381D71|nr:persephin [Camarhynchus parvulus]
MPQPRPPRSFLLLLLLLLLLGPAPCPAPPPPCALRSLRVGVADLGLGYAPSPEPLVFRYCGGRCPATPSLHALALGALGGAAEGAGRDLGRGLAPCCRPTRYEDAAFLDSALQWQRLPGLSAGACACLG